MTNSRITTILLLMATTAVVFWSCKKYKDPPPAIPHNIPSHYCNDPEAVNYNWGFPGTVDNSLCFYPADLFVGNYEYYDSVYINASGLFISSDSFPINIGRINANKSGITLSGAFCDPGSGNTLHFTANPGYTATVDTNIGDTLTLHTGQSFCHYYDTLNGSISRDRIDSSIIHFNLVVYSDTTTYSHIGHAVKK